MDKWNKPILFGEMKQYEQKVSGSLVSEHENLL